MYLDHFVYLGHGNNYPREGGIRKHWQRTDSTADAKQGWVRKFMAKFCQFICLKFNWMSCSVLHCFRCYQHDVLFYDLCGGHLLTLQSLWDPL